MGSRKKPDLISGIVPLYPSSIVEVKTGEVIEQAVFEQELSLLAAYVQQESENLWTEQKGILETKIKESASQQAAEIGREVGINADLAILPRAVKAKSRIERLIRYNVITSAKSYYNSKVETKEEPTFAPYLNLGAVDAQMAILNRLDENHIEMIFKCWEKEYVLTFKLPYYILNREIIKITLPIIKQWGDGWGFIFSLFEKAKPATINDKYIIGVDLGRVEPYTLAVVHARSGSRVAQYTASPRLRMLTIKRDRLNKELYFLKKKSETYEALGIERDTLEIERGLTRAKRNRVMDKISWQIAKEITVIAETYAARYVSMEDLSWVNPKHGMSRWTHSQDQHAITHKLTRAGRSTRKVDARNTSKDCSKCGESVIQKSGKRLIVCSGCSFTADRDVNAAVNIAIRPLPKRSKGSNCSSEEQVATDEICSNKRLSTSIIRNTS